MSVFGGKDKSRDIRDIVATLQEGTSAICNESVAGRPASAMEIDAMADEIKSIMLEHYSGIIGNASDNFLQGMIQEDAESAAQIFKNNITDSTQTLSESATMPSLVTLTASIATTMRTPYEATFHRLFDTRTLDKQVVEIEEVVPILKAPGATVEEDLIDALAPNAPTLFVDRTEIEVETLVNGIEPGCKDLALLEGKNPLFRINRDVRVSHVDVELDGTAVAADKIKMAKGSVPYFDAKTNALVCMFEITKDDGTIVTADVNAQLDFNRSVMSYLRCDPCITKVYFYATVDHSEHTHPIYTSFRNSFSQYIVPTRPHIEVSLPMEKRTDIQNSIQHFANTDIVTAMTENITTISTRMEDQRLKKQIDAAWEYQGEFSFEAPNYFAHGNLEWIKREFIPFLDQCALKLKYDWNITDCHFRVAVSPYILRILDTDYMMDKSLTEESRGSGLINYSIGCKTSTSTFYFISSQGMDDNILQMLLIPNNFTMSQVKTYNYFKYSSFLTDQLRRSDNHVQPAIVYSERNLPIVFRPLSARMSFTELPIQKDSGLRWIQKV